MDGLLTTAYLGVAAAIVAVAFFLDGVLRHRGAVAQPAGAALLVVTPVAVLWALALLTDSAMTPATVGLQIGASDMVHMAGATPDTDLFGHSLAMSLAGLTLAQIAEQVEARKLPPVEGWAPQKEGNSGMRIAADGTWFHDGSPITRQAMVRAFSGLLTRDESGAHFLISPFEKLSIEV